MKVIVSVRKDFEIEVNNELFETIHTIHQAGFGHYATSEQYVEAIKIIENLTGLPCDYGIPNLDEEVIYAVRNAETYIPIIEL